MVAQSLKSGRGFVDASIGSLPRRPSPFEGLIGSVGGPHTSVGGTRPFDSRGILKLTAYEAVRVLEREMKLFGGVSALSSRLA